MRKMLAATAFGILFVLSIQLMTAHAQYQPPHSKPGPAVDKLVFRASAQEQAPLELEKGDIDMYIFPLRVTTARELLTKSGISVLKAPATSLSILLNPAPGPRGQLNPLSIKEVRKAVQYLINRDYVAKELYGGLAAPMVAHISSYDYDYLTVRETVQKFNAVYDPELAKRSINDAMMKAGATLKDGKWSFGGREISLNFIIRTEDERSEIGRLLAAELEKVGFVVNQGYMDFGPAIQKVYTTDPKTLEWHLYTEGWGKSAIEKYDYATINQMYVPWLGNMPGWQEVGYWQYENPQADEIGKRLFTGIFKDANERDELYRTLTQIGLEESVRVWVTTVLSSFPVKSAVQGITSDLASGPKNPWTLRNAYAPGRSELKVGNLWVWTPGTTWNPVGGFTDIYSIDIWRNLVDPPLWKHPFTGVPIPFRATFSVNTAGPSSKLSVPGSAVMWDSASKSWQSVPAGTQATSRAVFNYGKYFGAKWHDGQPITMANVLYEWYQAFDLVYNPEKAKIEFASATTGKPYRDTFRGLRILNDTSVEVYVDYWHFEPSYIAEYAQPAGFSMPWHVLAAMDKLVFESGRPRAAYSNIAAEKFGVPWISLVENTHSLLVKEALSNFISTKYVPENVFTVGGKKYASVEDSVNGYRAAIDWFDKNKNMVVSNGPFQLTRFDPPSQSAELTAYRDPSYPFKAGDWYFGQPRLVEITGVRGGPLTIGSDTKFDVQVAGPGNIELRFVVVDPAQASEIYRGETKQAIEGTFSLQIPSTATARLRSGQYQLVLTAFSDQLSYVSERIETVRAVTPTTTPTTTATTTTTTATTPTTITTTPTTTTTTTTRVTTPTTRTTTLQTGPGGPDITLIAGGGVAALAVVAVVALTMRKPKKTQG